LLNLVIGIGGAIAVIVAAVRFLSPIGKVDLTVRIDQEVQASLPSGVTPNLQLVYDGKTITNASVIAVEIVNSGSTRIGADDQLWTLNVRSADGSRLVPLGNPRPIPASRHVSLSTGATADVATLTFGLFNSGDRVNLDVMLIEPKGVTGLPIVAETNVPDLKQPFIGRRNVRERLRDAFEPPVFLITFLGFAALAVRERRQLQRLGLPLAEVHKFPVGLLYVAMAAVFSSIVVVWVLARFAEGVLTR